MTGTVLRSLLPLLLAIPLVLQGCATTWTVRTAMPDAPLQWPQAPAAARLTYVGALTGVRPRGSGGALRDVVTGQRGADAGAFVLPVAVATAPDGRMAVADAGRRCVHLHLPSASRYVRLTEHGGEALVTPVGLAFDARLRLYVADSSGRLLVFGEDGGELPAIRAAGAGPLRRPTGLAYSPASALLYVVDTLEHRVHALRGTGELAFSFGGRGEAPGRFNFPTHIFRSSSGELYVTDALNFRVQIFDEGGTFRGSFGRHGNGSGDVAVPKGIAVDAGGTVYLVDGLFDNVQLFDREGQFLLTLGRRGTLLGEFWIPSGAFINERDELYVCDTYNRRIQVFRIARDGNHGAS